MCYGLKSRRLNIANAESASDSPNLLIRPPTHGSPSDLARRRSGHPTNLTRQQTLRSPLVVKTLITFGNTFPNLADIATTCCVPMFPIR